MSDQIRCIVGLGNPGPKYQETRHNAGFWFLDELARRSGAVCRAEAKFFGEICRIHAAGRECWLLKPMNFMNRSGQGVGALARFYKLPVESLLVVHDELDLPPGTVRLKKGGGHGGHNGLRDIVSVLGSKDFYRFRVGIGHPGHKDAVVDYVLSRPSVADRQAIERGIDEAVDHVVDLLAGEFQRVMNSLHSS